MHRPLTLSVVLSLALIVLSSPTLARKVEQPKVQRYTIPQHEPLPPDLQALVPRHGPVHNDTTYLGSWDFEGPGGSPQGWTTLDLSEQEGTFFHVAGPIELNGGKLTPLEGLRSMWCGVSPGPGSPQCSYVSPPGYGNNWSQFLCSDTLVCDSVRVYYKACWDTEAGYDEVTVEYLDDDLWLPLQTYDGSGSADECFAFAPSTGSTQIRVRFDSDGAWSDQDGSYDTDGAVLIDSITVQCFNGGVETFFNFEDFEGASQGDLGAGIWTAKPRPGFGDYGALHYAPNVLQNLGGCTFNSGFLWGFFDDPMITNYACDGFPEQGATPYGPDENGLYLSNAVVSPPIPVTGSGDRFILSYDFYNDRTLDQGLVNIWQVRSWVGGCPSAWQNNVFILGFENSGWIRNAVDISTLVDPAANFIQVQLGVLDLCEVYCGIWTLGDCHSHAPLYDNVEVARVDVIGPEFNVRHVDLFQDTFAEDGTRTGIARADAAMDIAPSASPTILPGDSITVWSLTGVGGDPNTGIGPAAYVYVAVWPEGQPGKTPADLEAPETRSAVGTRFPFVGTVVHDGVTWACFRMDSAVTSDGSTVAARYCFDLNDAVFTPGDTVCYVLAADDGLGNTNYWSRRLDGQGENFVTDSMSEALSSPLEFTILPAGGWARGGKILYVDDADDRPGPPQLYFDSAWKLYGQDEYVDRYDVLSPSSAAGNSLASRIKNIGVQLIFCYRGIVWNSGSLSSGLVGDGTVEKSDDFAALFTFLDSAPNGPGVLLMGDNIGSEWASLTGTSAVNLRSVYMNFNVANDSHVDAGEPVSPLLVEAYFCLQAYSPWTEFVIYGGCPTVRNFDVLQATGLSFPVHPYPNGSGEAMISQVTPNQNGSTARTVLAGFSFETIRDTAPGFPPVREGFLRAAFRCLLNGIGSIGPPTGVRDNHTSSFLNNAAPNPFNPETTIRYGVRKRGHVSLKVYNVAGQLVRTLVDDIKSPRPKGFEVTWDGRSDRGDAAATGVYFYKLVAPGFTETKKMVLLK